MDEYSILRKKRKKNGFAATSLLISIALALLVLVGAVLILGKVDNKKLNAVNDDSNMTLGSGVDVTCVGLTKEMIFNDNLRNIKEAAISYFTNERLPQTVGDTVKITLKEMKEKKIILDVIDSKYKSCFDDKTYVEVTKEENEYIMKIFLSCSDMEDYILVHLGCYDYCDSNVCEKKEEVVKEYEYEYKKTTSCVMSPWSDWGNWKTTREKVSNLKKEDIKTETSTKENSSTIDATANVTYNCNSYLGYKLVNDKCVKETTVTDTKNATPSKYSYNCDKYPGYKLVGTKCVKETNNKIEINATKNPITYYCPNGYKLNGKKCERTITKTEIVSATRVCPSGYSLNSSNKCVKSTTTTDTKDATRVCPSGYSLNSSNKCVKSTTTTDTKAAEAVYSTKKQYYTCYKDECTTKIVFSCPSGKTCGNYPQRSCEKVKKTCSKNVDYISEYKCASDYKLEETKDGNHICTKTTTITDTKDSTLTCPSGYSLNSNNKCVKSTTTTDTKDSTLTCPSGYNLNNDKCTKSYNVKEEIPASENPVTYTCPSGYDKNGTKCIRYELVRDEKESTKVPGGYVCPEGYTKNGMTCTKSTTTKDTKNASKVTSYTCPTGFTKNNTKCTKKVTETIKTTYYRYATRTCTGGNTDYKWSTSKNDSILKSEGYNLTGKKRELIIK